MELVSRTPDAQAEERPGLGRSLKEQLRFLADLCLAGHVAGETLEAKKSGDMQAPAFAAAGLRAAGSTRSASISNRRPLWSDFDVFVNAPAPHVDPGKLGGRSRCASRAAFISSMKWTTSTSPAW